jgi:putative transposase
MPRKPRHFKTDAIFHVGDRGVDRQPIFLTNGDREFFIETMEKNLRASNLRTVARCLMPNHFHWGIATAGESFERALHDTLTSHAVRFNRLHGRSGHLFEGRHWSEVCEDLDHVENMIAYIHMNPVRAKIVAHPGLWKWSSHDEWAESSEGTVDFARIESITGRDREELRANYRARVESELGGVRAGQGVEDLINDPVGLRSSRGEIRSCKARAHSTGRESGNLAELAGRSVELHSGGAVHAPQAAP